MESLQLDIPGVLLRPWREDDAESLALHANDPRIASCMRNGFPSPYTLNDARLFIETAIRQENILYAIEVRGEAAGGIGIHRLPDVYCGTAEIGYWLGVRYHGQGITTAAVRGIVPVAFALPGIMRLQAGIFAHNAASMRVLEKCGFCREAVHRNAITKNGRVMDEVLHALLREPAGKC